MESCGREGWARPRRATSRRYEEETRPVLAGAPDESSGLGLFSRSLVELDRIAVRILELDLLASGPHLDLVAEGRAGGRERRERGVEVADVQDDPVPSAGFLPPTVRHRPGARAARAAQ